MKPGTLLNWKRTEKAARQRNEAMRVLVPLLGLRNKKPIKASRAECRAI